MHSMASMASRAGRASMASRAARASRAFNLGCITIPVKESRGSLSWTGPVPRKGSIPSERRIHSSDYAPQHPKAHQRSRALTRDHSNHSITVSRQMSHRDPTGMFLVYKTTLVIVDRTFVVNLLIDSFFILCKNFLAFCNSS